MVAREGKAVFERSRERVGIIRGHGSEAFADVARRKHAGLFAQNAGGTAVVRHRPPPQTPLPQGRAT